MEILEDHRFVYHFTTGKNDVYIKLKTMTKETGLSKNSDGYHRVDIDGKKKLVHRVLYEKYHGDIPDNLVIDHINRIPTDNRISNLRLVSKTQNSQNRTKLLNNTSGEKNVCWDKRGSKWQVSIGVNGKLKFYGYFQNIEDAVIKRDQAILELNAQGHLFTV